MKMTMHIDEDVLARVMKVTGAKTKRQAVEVIADTVQFLGGRDAGGDGAGGGGGNQFVPAGAAAGADADFTATDDDIPF